MKTLYVKDRGEWRSWLEKNAGGFREIFLIYYKKGSGKPRVAYEDAVQEALCFGWIDGRVNKLDDQRYVQRFTPRRPASRWSALNIKRARKLIAQGKMTAAGLAVFNPARKTAVQPAVLPGDLEQKFKRHAEAWGNFQRFAPFYRRMTIAWVASAKKEETRIKRLQQLVGYSAQNRRIKFM
jgi:uncharacterized protein YdeI (YjbR/CyaY-like superfamily)